MSVCTDRVWGDRQAGARRHSTSVLVDCSGKGALPAIADFGAIVGADAVPRGWIGLTMKPLIGYGSDVSASGPALLVGDKTSTLDVWSLAFIGNVPAGKSAEADYHAVKASDVWGVR